MVFSLGVLLFVMLYECFPNRNDLFCLSNSQSVFAVSQKCIIFFLLACLQRHPEHRIPLEQMLYHDWLMLGFLNTHLITRMHLISIHINEKYVYIV
ncbi:hypothetical protein G5714_002837 [Onychostoma macrolepis]|uniref:non-specific serine/threonine protein kinase n=1 Tax=Onychostoma macrolepis TaxID=369639 RepID=A0A7J6D7S5_9TELE|nr:hypothetical protein G5714_002837 [Onychostoma macrolepis]